MRYMVIERYMSGAAPIYERVAERGRMLPEGLTYLDSWVDERLERCFQLMETGDVTLFDEWTARWADLTEFEIVPVLASAEARGPCARCVTLDTVAILCKVIRPNPLKERPWQAASPK